VARVRSDGAFDATETRVATSPLGHRSGRLSVVIGSTGRLRDRSRLHIVRLVPTHPPPKSSPTALYVPTGREFRATCQKNHVAVSRAWNAILSNYNCSTYISHYSRVRCIADRQGRRPLRKKMAGILSRIRRGTPFFLGNFACFDSQPRFEQRLYGGQDQLKSTYVKADDHN
jgi:hypothetical protein